MDNDVNSVIAIIGAGPRGVAALQSLASQVTNEHPVEVHLFGVYDDAGRFVAGQGTPFSITQPHFSRLNARSAVVDQFAPYRETDIPIYAANPSDAPHTPRGETDENTASTMIGDNFDAWAEKNYPEWVDDFPPRAIVGEYLDYAAHFVIDHLPAALHLTCHGRATSVAGSPGAWVITGADGSVEATDILLTVGHAEHSPNAMTQEHEDADMLIATPYPVEQLDAINPGATVATRGAGLSFIDIALALTEGRGGKFSADGSAYTPSGREPAVIYPTGLEGVFLDAKPNIDQIQNALPEKRWNETRKALTRESTMTQIMSDLHTLAIDALNALGYDSPEHLYDEFLQGTEPKPGQARDRLVESLGEETPARTVIVGAILTVMDSLLGAVANREFEINEWKKFSALITLVNSYGFGPPESNVRKILTLIDAGFISTQWLDDGVDATDLPQHVDVMVEAVLAPAGYWTGAYRSLEPIDGYLSTWADPDRRTGVRTNNAGLVLDANERPIESLAAIGRITEDWVISTDTLNMSEHPYIENWAARFAR